MFHGSFQCVSRVFERSSKGIPGKGQICFKVFQGSLKGVPRNIKGCFKEVSRVFFKHGIFLLAKKTLNITSSRRLITHTFTFMCFVLTNGY